MRSKTEDSSYHLLTTHRGRHHQSLGIISVVLINNSLLRGHLMPFLRHFSNFLSPRADNEEHVLQQTIAHFKTYGKLPFERQTVFYRIRASNLTFRNDYPVDPLTSSSSH